MTDMRMCVLWRTLSRLLARVAYACIDRHSVSARRLADGLHTSVRVNWRLHSFFSFFPC